MLVKILAEALYLRTSSGTFTDRTSPTFFDGVTSSVSDTDRTVSDVRVGNVGILSPHGALRAYTVLFLLYDTALFNEKAVVKQLVVLTVNEKLRNESVIYHTFI